MKDSLGTGVGLARGVFAPEDVDRWRAAVTASILAGPRDPFNPVAVELPELLREIARHSDFIEMAKKRLDSYRLSLYNERLVVKDAAARGPVFLHQDCAYHKGGLDKWSAFVALTESSARNGGLTVYPGTHVYGSLGDAGEIDRAMLAAVGAEPWTPSMNPGDVLLMHSATWHESGAHTEGPDRILVDIILSPGEDPFCLPLSGPCTATAPAALHVAPLVRSRVSRIRELEAEVRALRTLKSLHDRSEDPSAPAGRQAADGRGRGRDRIDDEVVSEPGQADRAERDAASVGRDRGVPAGERP